MKVTTALLLLEGHNEGGRGLATCLDPTGSTDTRVSMFGLLYGLYAEATRKVRATPRRWPRLARVYFPTWRVRGTCGRTPTAVHPRLRDGVAGDTSRSSFRSPPRCLFDAHARRPRTADDR